MRKKNVTIDLLEIILQKGCQTPHSYSGFDAARGFQTAFQHQLWTNPLSSDLVPNPRRIGHVIVHRRTKALQNDGNGDATSDLSNMITLWYENDDKCSL